MCDVSIDITKPVLLIDGSYYVFYRFYAIYNWWSRQDENQGKTGKDAMSDPSFKEKYNKMFKSVLTNLTKLYEVPPSNVIFARDCPRDKIWRNDHFDQYKGTRDDTRLDNFDKTVFSETFTNTLPGIDCHVLSIDRLEADDIIALITKKIISIDKSAEVIIITNDNDYLQLLPLGENIQIVNLQGKQLKDRMEYKNIDKYILFKAILGDKSDNIPSIAGKIGIKRAEKLANEPEELQKLFKKTPESFEQYKKNDLLMNFENIPKDFENELFKRVSIYKN